MIDALITGCLSRATDEGDAVTGRLITDTGLPVELLARRGVVRRDLLACHMGLPIAVAGRLSTYPERSTQGKPFVRHWLEVTAVLTPQSGAEPEPAAAAAPLRTRVRELFTKGTPT